MPFAEPLPRKITVLKLNTNVRIFLQYEICVTELQSLKIALHY